MPQASRHNVRGWARGPSGLRGSAWPPPPIGRRTEFPRQDSFPWFQTESRAGRNHPHRWVRRLVL